MSDSKPPLAPPDEPPSALARWSTLLVWMGLLALAWSSPMVAGILARHFDVREMLPPTSFLRPDAFFLALLMAMPAWAAAWIVAGPGWIWFRAAVAACLFPVVAALSGGALAWIRSALEISETSIGSDLEFYCCVLGEQVLLAVAAAALLRWWGVDWFGLPRDAAPQMGLRDLLALTVCAALLSSVIAKGHVLNLVSPGSFAQRWPWFLSAAGCGAVCGGAAMAAADVRVPLWLGMPVGALVAGGAGLGWAAVNQAFAGIEITLFEYLITFAAMVVVQFAFALFGIQALRAAVRLVYEPTESKA